MFRYNFLIFSLTLAVVISLLMVAVFYMNTTSNELTRPEWLKNAQQLNVNDIKEIWIVAGRHGSNKREAVSIRLQNDKDKDDIARLLSALKNIQITNNRKRVPAIQERIVIRSRKRTITLYGYFDPARAPVISPTMRSNDVSRIIQEIGMRKGEKYPP